jgi:8-hydroxy-5-deazaflavin:NADPH oxidoreductase
LEDNMKITVIGRGNVGGGLAKRWRDAGHDVDELGRDGGDASNADVVVVAVPASAIADALAKVTGLEGKIAVDATNAVGGRPEGFESLAHQVASLTNGPTAKAFNTIFARVYDRIDGQSCLWAGDDDAREATERLIRDAGLEPVRVGGLEHAAGLEDALLGVMFPTSQSLGGPFFYRIEPAG